MKTAIITGAAGNLGQALVKKFLNDAYNVVGSFTPTGSIDTAIQHPSFEKVEVNLLEEESASLFVRSATEKYKHIDVAVLTVGGFAMGNITDTSSADILKQYQLNFETAYNIARPVFIQMLAQKTGRIFLVGSKPGLDAQKGKGMVAYGLAKSLIFRLAELMNDEAKMTNVVTAVVIPGTIDTPQNRKSMPEADFSDWVKPEEIANLIAYHSSEQATSMRETMIKIYGNS